MIITLLIMAAFLVTGLIYFFAGGPIEATCFTCYAIVTGVIYLIIRYRNK